jgi:hypothetical protein
MSRAVSTVLKAPSESGYFSAQPSATSCCSAKASSICSGVAGRGSAAMIRSFSSGGMHSTGVDSPTPRGSKPTTSKRRSTSSGRVSAEPIAASAPEAPGPPGLMTSEPIRSVCWAQRARTRNSGSVSPCGSS